MRVEQVERRRPILPLADEDPLRREEPLRLHLRERRVPRGALRQALGGEIARGVFVQRQIGPVPDAQAGPAPAGCVVIDDPDGLVLLELVEEEPGPGSVVSFLTLATEAQTTAFVSFVIVEDDAGRVAALALPRLPAACRSATARGRAPCC